MVHACRPAPAMHIRSVPHISASCSTHVRDHLRQSDDVVLGNADHQRHRLGLLALKTVAHIAGVGQARNNEDRRHWPRQLAQCSVKQGAVN